MLTRTIAIVLLLAAAAGAEQAQTVDRWEWFPALEAERYGCKIDSLTVQEPTGEQHDAWDVHVWVTKVLSGERLQLLWSRSPSLDKAMDECRDWMKEARKRVRRARGQANGRP